MPVVSIECRKEWPPEQVQAIMDAVHSAMCDALKIPERDRQIRFIAHAPEHFQVPPDKSENYTLIQIALFAGRSIEAKRDLYRLIVERLGTLGIAPADVFIMLNEIARENWGIRGGVPASDVDWGAPVQV